jgi:hypothetical protein
MAAVLNLRVTVGVRRSGENVEVDRGGHPTIGLPAL